VLINLSPWLALSIFYLVFSSPLDILEGSCSMELYFSRVQLLKNGPLGRQSQGLVLVFFDISKL
jgi:hypothetical protein